MDKAKLTKQPPPASRQPWVIGAVLAVIGVLVVAVFALTRTPQSTYAPEYTGGARAEIDSESLDFGDVKFEEMVNASFNVRNVGDRPLNIIGEPYVELVEGC